MKKKTLNGLKLALVAVTLPFIYGCGGAGTSSLLGFLFGGGAGIGDIALLGSSGGGAIAGGAASAASLVNPEPASMLLVGSGVAAMSYFKAKSNKRS